MSHQSQNKQPNKGADIIYTLHLEKENSICTQRDIIMNWTSMCMIQKFVFFKFRDREYFILYNKTIIFSCVASQV